MTDVQHSNEKPLELEDCSEVTQKLLSNSVQQDIPVIARIQNLTSARSTCSTPTSVASGSSALMQSSSVPRKCGNVDLLVAFPPEVMERYSHVLVVDDSQINRKMICRSLQSLGFICEQATDGVNCIDIVSRVWKEMHSEAFSGGNENRIDLILMDYEMPRLNGPLAVAQLREIGIDIPVIGITGNVLKEDSEYFIECGANKVIHKPFSVQMLEKALLEIFNNTTK